MIFHYRDLSYSIGDDYVRIYDTIGKEVGKINTINKENHLNAQRIIDKIVDKKPKVKIGLVEIDPYVWEVYEDGKKYLGVVKQNKADSYMCFRADDRYSYYMTTNISGIMDYFRTIAKEI
mgnify:CR=1 FL=1